MFENKGITMHNNTRRYIIRVIIVIIGILSLSLILFGMSINWQFNDFSSLMLFYYFIYGTIILANAIYSQEFLSKYIRIHYKGLYKRDMSEFFVIIVHTAIAIGVFLLLDFDGNNIVTIDPIDYFFFISILPTLIFIANNKDSK
jgi:hypothetical protein